MDLPKQIGGVKIPDSILAASAMRLVEAASPKFLVNHCLRTYTFGGLLAKKRGMAFDEELAFVASALHDLGLTSDYASEDQRFEIDGADAAKAFLLEHNVTGERAELVWDAIVLHSTGGIPPRKAPEVALVHLGAAADVLGLMIDEISADDVERVVDVFPRLNFKKAFLDLLIDHVRRKPMAQAFSWTAEIGRVHVPGFPCPTVDEAIAASPFRE